MESLNLTSEQRAAFADLLGKKDVDVLRSMLSLVYDVAIQGFERNLMIISVRTA